jgi:hypothetical protein
MSKQAYSLLLRLLGALGVKIEAGTPLQTKIFMLLLGLALTVTGCNGVLSAPDHSPGRRWFSQLLYEVLGPYAQDYLSVIFGIWMIYYAVFKCTASQKRFNKLD